MAKRSDRIPGQFERCEKCGLTVQINAKRKLRGHFNTEKGKMCSGGNK